MRRRPGSGRPRRAGRAIAGAPAQVEVTYEGTAHHVVLDDWRMTSIAAGVFAVHADTRPSWPSPRRPQRPATATSHRSAHWSRTRSRVGRATQHGRSALLRDAVLGRRPATTTPVTSTTPTRVADPTSGLRPAESRRSTEDFSPFTPQTWVTRADYDTAACLALAGRCDGRRHPFPSGRRCPTCRSWFSTVTWTPTPTSAAGRRPRPSSRTLRSRRSPGRRAHPGDHGGGRARDPGLHRRATRV